jgi:hypothetical protein
MEMAMGTGLSLFMNDMLVQAPFHPSNFCLKGLIAPMPGRMLRQYQLLHNHGNMIIHILIDVAKEAGTVSQVEVSTQFRA